MIENAHRLDSLRQLIFVEFLGSDQLAGRLRRKWVGSVVELGERECASGRWSLLDAIALCLRKRRLAAERRRKNRSDDCKERANRPLIQLQALETIIIPNTTGRYRTEASTTRRAMTVEVEFISLLTWYSRYVPASAIEVR